MIAISIALFWCLTTLVIIQIPYVIAFIQQLRQTRADSALPRLALPKATIILCLRGADPFLPDCLKRLLSQDYPNYQLHIVVDNPDDPAWSVVNQIVTNQTDLPVKVSSLRVRHATCSLKCSALLQAVAELDSDCEIVALLDADTITHPTWLQELVTPLQDPQIGATTGNRWYMPSSNGWGSLIRYLWNASVIVYMYKYTIPWGGSLAVRAEIVRQPELLQQWQQSLVEDATLYQAIKARGLQIQPVLSVLMVNREDCQLSSFLRWLQRQFVFVRLYHPAWTESVCFNGIILALLLCLYALLPVAIFIQQWQAAAWLSGAVLLNLSISVLLLIGIHREVCLGLDNRGEANSPFSAIALVKLLIGIPLSQLLCNLMLISALLVRRIEWRGITYHIQGPQQIQLEQYNPYQPLNPASSMVSLW
ncbi:glycosyltransferase family 2 protein [Leptolyngbya sp. NK1-12]|uniref:Glycosyltransferase family 2 protein n=1 Tax=Leptolyngbya sp. NK1-12 TaxID=2547451 RepID=A0AA96WAU7_9CYAN|nr:glycosyltransferase family 2 protein [Leptolyngbya sp. NK1-12]WNZ21699.1 glycosyltransferase family 2 protein [Leptolyngbya sp. NK1-12]